MTETRKHFRLKNKIKHKSHEQTWGYCATRGPCTSRKRGVRAKDYSHCGVTNKHSRPNRLSRDSC